MQRIWNSLYSNYQLYCRIWLSSISWWVLTTFSAFSYWFGILIVTREMTKVSPHETIIWNISALDHACHYTLMETYPTHISQQEIVIHKQQGTFRFRRQPSISTVLHCDLPPSSLQAVSDYIIVPEDVLGSPRNPVIGRENHLCRRTCQKRIQKIQSYSFFSTSRAIELSCDSVHYGICSFFSCDS